MAAQNAASPSALTTESQGNCPPRRYTSMELVHKGSLRMSNSNSSITSARFSKVTPALTDKDDLSSDRHLEGNLSSKIAAMAERRAQISDWRQQLVNNQEELKRARNLINELEKEKNRVLDELQEMKKVAEDANLRLSEALLAQENWKSEKSDGSQSENVSTESAKKGDHAWQLEIDAIRKQHALDVEALLAVTEELNKLKQELALSKNIKMEDVNMNKDASGIANLRNSSTKKSPTLSGLARKEFPIRDEHVDSKVSVEVTRQTTSSLSELEDETKYTGTGEGKLVHTDSQVEQPMQEVNVTIGFKPRVLSLLSNSSLQCDQPQMTVEKVRESESKNFEAKTPNADLVHSADYQEALAKEITSLRNELRLATEAEDNSRKATDELALTLKEVTEDANQVKAKLASTTAELESSRMEVEYTNVMLKNSEERYQTLLGETRKEIDNAKQSVERLKLEADESSEAWNDKELVFVECIRKSEKEVAEMKDEKQRFVELLEVAESAVKEAKAENDRLRDILKQALSEATVAKEASEIAKAENSELKDSVSALANTIENLKTNEAANIEKISELKAMVEKNGNTNKASESKDMKKTISSLSRRWKSSTVSSQKPLTLNPELERPQPQISSGKDTPDFDILEGTIFTDDSPKKGKAASTSKTHFHRKASSLVLSADGSSVGNQFDAGELSPTAKQKTKRAILQKFGSFLGKKASSRN